MTFILSNKVDILALTETWLGSNVDKSVISELIPNGYHICHIPRSNKKELELQSFIILH